MKWMTSVRCYFHSISTLSPLLHFIFPKDQWDLLMWCLEQAVRLVIGFVKTLRIIETSSGLKGLGMFTLVTLILCQGWGRSAWQPLHRPFYATNAGVCRWSQRRTRCTVQTVWSTLASARTSSQSDSQRSQTLWCSVQVGEGFVQVVFHCW